jgi:hypothetical protein
MDKDEAHRIRGAVLSNLYSTTPQPMPDFRLRREAAETQSVRIGESEYNHQRRLHAWLVRQDVPHFHCPNELCRTEADGRMQSLIGMYPGVPDIAILVARKPYHGLFLELKRDDGVVSGAQAYWLEVLSAQGYLALVSHAFDRSVKIVEEYLARGAW